MHLVVSVRLFVHLFVRLCVLSCLKTITSQRYLSVSVNVGRLRLISRMRLIGFSLYKARDITNHKNQIMMYVSLLYML